MSGRVPVRRVEQRRGSRLIPVLAVATLALAGLMACGQQSEDAVAQTALASSSTASSSTAVAAPLPAPAAMARKGRAPAIKLGAGLMSFPDAADQWVAANPGDPRAGAIAGSIADQPTALWLTGDESFGNLSAAVSQARASNRTMVLTLYNIPLRYDGLSALSPVSLHTYKRWIDRVAAQIGTTRAIVVLEPDALWFYDRMPTDESRAVRMAALNYAVDTMAKKAPRSRVYLEAGTSSGSVTPDRMAALLVQAGLSKAAGYAVNVSSYAPTSAIQAYAQQIRAALQSRGVANPRYVTDTGRNGAGTWDYTWCNPTDQRLGSPPKLLRKSDGRDLDLWIKAPGTSDGDCGPAGGGAGTYGGEFIPALAYAMLGH